MESNAQSDSSKVKPESVDSLRFTTMELPAVEIRAFESAETILETAASISSIRGMNESSNSISGLELFNQYPGIQFEQRSPGSYRVNIRGSSLRSPFDVRNVKIYWNDIPITEPGGNTPLNLFEAQRFSQVNVIRGPVSSVYGVGNGGVLLIQTDDWEDQGASLSFSAGSFGERRLGVSAGWKGESDQHSVNFNHVQTEGYRQHSAFRRSVIEYKAELGSQKDLSNWELNMLYTDLFYEIPGGLTEEQYREDPKQARPGNPFIQGTEESNSSIDVSNLLLGVTHKISKGNSSFRTTVYANAADFENPFIFDYKKEQQISAGARSLYNWNLNGKYLKELIAGGEWQYRKTMAANFGNVQGKRDSLNFLDDIKSSTGIVFLRTKFALTEKIRASAGISFNQLNYRINRLEDRATDSTYIINRTFEPVFIPRFSLQYALGNGRLYSQIGWGYSPPTLEEVRTNEGSINTDLNAERGRNIELGYKLERPFLSGNLFSALSLFNYQLTNTITDYTSNRGTDLFRNAGFTQQQGLEALAEWSKSMTQMLVSFRASYTYHDFIYGEYEASGTDFSGNLIPGISPKNWSFSSEAELNNGLSANLIYLYRGIMYLNDENTVTALPYHLLDLTIKYKMDLKSGMRSEVFFRLGNILDQKLSFGNDLNAFGGRYFQPSAGRNFQLGLSLGFRS